MFSLRVFIITLSLLCGSAAGLYSQTSVVDLPVDLPGAKLQIDLKNMHETWQQDPDHLDWLVRAAPTPLTAKFRRLETADESATCRLLLVPLAKAAEVEISEITIGGETMEVVLGTNFAGYCRRFPSNALVSLVVSGPKNTTLTQADSAAIAERFFSDRLKSSVLADTATPFKTLAIDAFGLRLDFKGGGETWVLQGNVAMPGDVEGARLQRVQPGLPIGALIVHYKPNDELPLTKQPAGIDQACIQIVAAFAKSMELEIAPFYKNGLPYASGAKGYVTCRDAADGGKFALLVKPVPGSALLSDDANVITEALRRASEFESINGSISDDSDSDSGEGDAADEGTPGLVTTPQITYMYGGDELGDNFPGYFTIGNSLFSLEADVGPVSAASFDMHFGSTIKGGFGFETSLGFGYGFRPLHGVALGAMIDLGVDGVTGGRLPFSFRASTSVFAKFGSDTLSLLLRADNSYQHRKSRRQGSENALLGADELRLEVGIIAGGCKVALRAQEFLGARFVGLTFGLVLGK